MDLLGIALLVVILQAMSKTGPNKTLLRSLGHRHFLDLTGTKAKRNYANNVSEYNTVLASLNAKRSKGNRRYDVIECDPLVRKGLEKTAKHMVIPYMSMLLPPQNWTGYDQCAYLFLPSYVLKLFLPRFIGIFS
ncbi:hypothetical protein ERO13_A04G054932v2 [Gossypium hirsutum]|nr:hypothetical protein ERO13_A04G054932v2 [Gossypium hirsutum]KAG4204579.1 hypothetical protein ERO13_A04G054932v2 [Gossypium hirsutum]